MCCKQLSADHSPAAGGRVSRSTGSVLTSRCQRSGVVARTACICSNTIFSNLFLSFLVPDSVFRSGLLVYRSRLCTVAQDHITIPYYKIFIRPLENVSRLVTPLSAESQRAAIREDEYAAPEE